MTTLYEIRKNRSRELAAIYLKRGAIRQEPCERCGDPDSEMHHEDYSRPLSVSWLCHPCHRQLHLDESAEQVTARHARSLVEHPYHSGFLLLGRYACDGGCSRCHEDRAPNSRYCNKCKAEYMREWRKTHPLNAEQRRRANARSMAHVYRDRGLLPRSPCCNCGNPEAEMHHHDYDKPIDIVWLCKECHKKHHDGEPINIVVSQPQRKYKKDDRCSKCGEPKQPGQSYCHKHKVEYQRAWQREYRLKRSAQSPPASPESGIDPPPDAAPQTPSPQ